MSFQELWVRVQRIQRPKHMAQSRTLAFLTMKFSIHDDISLEYSVSKALGVLILVVEVLRSSRED